MQIQVLFFAVVKERLKQDGQSLDLPAGASIDDALAALALEHPGLAPLLSRLQVAVNRQVQPGAHRLADGDELALLPPVAGGTHPLPRIAVLDTHLSLDTVVSVVSGPAQGGLVTFTGMVRRQGQRPNVVELQYEAYVPMATEVMTAVADEIEAEWPGTAVAIHHRTGVLKVGDIAVVIAVSAPHRAEAFAGCRAAIDRLKDRVPIWKKEIDEAGEAWIGMGP